VVGLGGMVGSIFAAFFAEIVGHILQASGQYTGLFLFCGSAYLVSAALFHLLAPRMIPAAIE
jgi:ACS family hexuronate transporter-like MFS transporter